MTNRISQVFSKVSETFDASFSGNLYEIVVLNDVNNSRHHAEVCKLLRYPKKRPGQILRTPVG